MAIQITPAGDRLAWGIKSGNQPERSRDEIAEMIHSGEALRLAKDEYAGIATEPIRSLLDNVDEKNVQVWAPYGLPDLPRWHARRTCLIGDAAHAMPPNGQGTGLAFEDAAYLGRLLGMHLDTGLAGAGERTDKVFAHWQEKRQRRTADVKRVSGKWGAAPAKKVDPNGWVWWAKRWGMWAFISVVKRGNMSAHGFSGYDVMKEDTAVQF